ncbi:hypothetical protein BRAO375_1200026 [Bradyrhizobium sp. ORS 375]|nr:hypothetical protein BRAO375_1200026 [Bradyrhizobium sp. ORS 375]
MRTMAPLAVPSKVLRSHDTTPTFIYIHLHFHFSFNCSFLNKIVRNQCQNHRRRYSCHKKI